MRSTIAALLLSMISASCTLPPSQISFPRDVAWRSVARRQVGGEEEASEIKTFFVSAGEKWFLYMLRTGVGASVFMYDGEIYVRLPDSQEISPEEAAALDPRVSLSHLYETASYNGNDEIEGGTCFRYSMDLERTKVEMWIDAETLMPVRVLTHIQGIEERPGVRIDEQFFPPREGFKFDAEYFDIEVQKARLSGDASSMPAGQKKVSGAKKGS